MRRRNRILLGVLGTAAVLAGVAIWQFPAIQRRLVIAYSAAPGRVADPPPDLSPQFDGPDAHRRRIAVSLTPVATGIREPTDVQFAPGRPDPMFVLEKGGTVRVVSNGRASAWLTIPVLTASEEGLLGLAFHPRFAENGRFYLDFVASDDGHDVTRVEEWAVPPGDDLRTARPERRRVLLEQVQPYPNHNAGQLAFGPDGKLYVGLGDGGWRGDPHGNGQNPDALLGKMLRLDVDGESLIPADNPFVGRAGWRPEIWALGLRNPWRYAFTPDGRLVVGDVGQDRFEEVSIVERGGNYGWNVREGRHCYPPDAACAVDGFTDPIWEYGRDEGNCITGGVVYTGSAVPALRGRYVFGDFGSGRLWAMDLPPGVQKVDAVDTVDTLGRWPIAPSTFGRDPAGEVYVADFGRGVIYRISAP